MTARDIHKDVIENAIADAATSGSNSIPHAPCSVGSAMPRTFTGRDEAGEMLLTRSSGFESKIVPVVDDISQYYPIAPQIK